MGTAKVSDLGWHSKGQGCKIKGPIWSCSDKNTHDVSIPVSRNWEQVTWLKTRFRWKMVGGCSIYGVLAPWHNLTRSTLVANGCAKNAPLALQNFSAVRRALRRSFLKNSWWLYQPLPVPARVKGTSEHNDYFEKGEVHQLSNRAVCVSDVGDWRKPEQWAQSVPWQKRRQFNICGVFH